MKMMLFLKTMLTVLPVVLSSLFWTSGVLAQNKTPAKKKVIYFGSVDFPGIPVRTQYKAIFKNRVEAEGYEFVTYEYNANPLLNEATITNLYRIADAKDYAMLIIHCHGSPAGLGIEEFARTPAGVAARGVRIKRYKSKTYTSTSDSLEPIGTTAVTWNKSDFGKYLRATNVGEAEPNPPGKAPGIRISGKGLKALFSDVPKNSIVILMACHSRALQSPFATPKLPFGNAEVFSFRKVVKHSVAGNVVHELMQFMSGEQGAGKRSTAQAYASCTQAPSNKFFHSGKPDPGFGNVVLAPAVTAATPTVISPGTTILSKTVEFDTKMNQGNTNILVVEAPDDCVLSFANKKWIGGGTALQFDVASGTLTPQGPFSVVKVIPINDKNGHALVGNRWDLNANPSTATPPPWLDPSAPTDKANAPPTFGLNGYDGVPHLPPNNPFRWVIYCDGFRNGNLAIKPWDNTDIETLEPESDQEPYDNQGEKQTASNLVDSLFLYPYFTHEVDPIGEDVAYVYYLLNDGDTQMSDIQISATAVVGPGGAIDPNQITIEPSSIELLEPGSHATVTITVQTDTVNTQGLYVGDILVDAAGSYQTDSPIEIFLDHAPVLTGPPDEPILFHVGTLAQVQLDSFDGDGDTRNYYVEGDPYYVEGAPEVMVFEGGGSLATFTWTPGQNDTGLQSFATIVNDGFLDGIHYLKIDVEGPIDVNVVPVPAFYDPDLPLLLEIAYYNKNTSAALLTTETVEVFSDGFGGTLIYNVSQNVGATLDSEQEQLREIVIPAQPDQVGLFIRVTAATSLNGNDYTYIDEVLFPDCNYNDVFDSLDINDGTSHDCTGNGVPDECESDCNNNGTADSCDLLNEISDDCNGSGVPDECELGSCISLDERTAFFMRAPIPDGDEPPYVGPHDDNQTACCVGNNDCNNNGILDECE